MKQTNRDAQQMRALTQKLMDGKMRIMREYSFYGIILAGLPMALDDTLDTAATDGDRLYFSPDFLESLTENELDFVMLHEVLHICLKHVLRQKNRNHFLFNVACDIVVNSHIRQMGVPIKVDGTESMHIAPDGKEGMHYTAEEVYRMLMEGSVKKKKKPSDEDDGIPGSSGGSGNGEGKSKSNKKNKSGNKKSKTAADALEDADLLDSHDRWKNATRVTEVAINRALARAAGLAPQIQHGSAQIGNLPAELQRSIAKLKKSKANWREELQAFLQPDIYDYTYLPPDKKRSDDFFYPQLRPIDGSIHHIMFMVDTSCSVSDEELTQLLSEIQGAVNQFDGNMDGYVGFFDAAVHSVTPFDGETDITRLKPIGGGGTSFHCIFDYLKRHMSDELPEVMVILTDGWADFPPESDAMDIPVLWALYGEKCNTNIPWGKTIEIEL